MGTSVSPWAKAAGALKRSVSERFTNPEDDPTVPELLSRAMRRLRTALTHCDPAEIKVWRCRLTVSKPMLKAPMVSALEAKI